jgi:hypothetical protein
MIKTEKIFICFLKPLSLNKERGRGEVVFAFLLALFFFSQAYSQVENIPADNPVYSFLKEMNLKGALPEYDDVILPLSRQQVISLLAKTDSSRSMLSTAEQEYLDRMKQKFYIEKNPLVLSDDFPGGLLNKLADDRQKHFYFYTDSTINFYVDPLVDYKFIYSDWNKANSSLLNYGGSIKGSYNNWLGFSLTGTLGIQFNNRETAELDKRVEQSFSFNDTRNQYFDKTNGYLRIAYGITSLQLGREKQLWGNGYIDKMYISDNSPDFDFIRFGIAYKSLSYRMICAWLVHPTDSVFVDSVQWYVKQKPAKYLVMSRLGFNPGRHFSAGITQAILYSHRPFEIAYLNPFIFLESAQRSLNDLDNSMLNFDARWMISDGLEVSGCFIFDDIRSSNWFEGKWNAVQNRVAWQSGVMLTSPVLPDNFTLKIEYMQLRPYVFSHFGMTASALTYTNNGYFIGADLNPNSTRLSAEINYRPTGKLNLTFLFKHTLHGMNTYDTDGNLITSYGGDIYRPITLKDPGFVKILDGNREETNLYSLKADYELTYGIYFSFFAAYEKHIANSQSTGRSWFWSSVILNFD